MNTTTAEPTSETEAETCECASWCHPGSYLHLSHHPRCAKYNPLKECRDLITALIRGIESAAADTDGIHPDLWEAYKDGKAAIGDFDWIEDGPSKKA